MSKRKRMGCYYSFSNKVDVAVETPASTFHKRLSKRSSRRPKAVESGLKGTESGFKGVESQVKGAECAVKGAEYGVKSNWLKSVNVEEAYAVVNVIDIVNDENKKADTPEYLDLSSAMSEDKTDPKLLAEPEETKNLESDWKAVLDIIENKNTEPPASEPDVQSETTEVVKPVKVKPKVPPKPKRPRKCVNFEVVSEEESSKLKSYIYEELVKQFQSEDGTYFPCLLT